MKLDPVDQKALKGPHSSAKDKDINNDGKVNSSDEYLHKRRQAVSKALGKLKEAALEEKKLTDKQVKNALASAKAKPKETVSLKKPPFKMEEEVEELDELSKKTLGSYTRKAASSMGTAAYDLAKKQSDSDEVDRMTNRNMPNQFGVRSQMKKAMGADDDSQEKNRNTIGKRMQGINKATAKLAKEEVELDEVSASTLGSYVRKSTKDAAASFEKRNDALDNNDGETARKMGRQVRKRDKGSQMAMDKLKGTRYAKVHATEEVTSSKNATVKAVKPNVSNNNAVTTIADVKPLRMKLAQFRKQE